MRSQNGSFCLTWCMIRLISCLICSTLNHQCHYCFLGTMLTGSFLKAHYSPRTEFNLVPRTHTDALQKIMQDVKIVKTPAKWLLSHNFFQNCLGKTNTKHSFPYRGWRSLKVKIQSYLRIIVQKMKRGKFQKQGPPRLEEKCLNWCLKSLTVHINKLAKERHALDPKGLERHRCSKSGNQGRGEEGQLDMT